MRSSPAGGHDHRGGEVAAGSWAVVALVFAGILLLAAAEDQRVKDGDVGHGEEGRPGRRGRVKVPGTVIPPEHNHRYDRARRGLDDHITYRLAQYLAPQAQE